MQSDLNQLAAPIFKDATELLKELLKESNEMRAARERDRDLRRRLRLQRLRFIRNLYARQLGRSN